MPVNTVNLKYYYFQKEKLEKLKAELNQKKKNQKKNLRKHCDNCRYNNTIENAINSNNFCEHSNPIFLKKRIDC